MNKQHPLAIITLGCAKNEVDSDHMRSKLAAAGFPILEGDDPQIISQAHVVIVNTCAFLTEAVEEGLEVIFDVLGLDSFQSGKAKLIVCGCMPSRYGDELPPELPEVALFLDPADEEDIVSQVERVLDEDGDSPVPGSVPEGPLRTLGQTWAYVKIADGCSRCCSYCMIPSIRGPYRSIPYTDILQEVDLLVSSGTHEVILIAQDTGIWGRDLSKAPDVPNNTAQLLDELASRYPETWFRLMYIQPQAVSDELLSVISKHGNICSYLDIPLQHVSRHVLEDMNRSGDPDSINALLDHIRVSMPGITLRTTLMIGFPGETRSDAKTLLDWVGECGIDYIGTFIFSPEDGTVAASMENQVPIRTKRARLQRIRDAADRLGFQKAAEHVGAIEDVLVYGYEYDEATGQVHRIGRTQGQAPDVDGVTYVPEGLPEGIHRLRIVDSVCYDLFAEGIEDE